MPDEPNGKIDELLRAYAQKRREDAGAPLVLHPATRKLLQSEVARLRPRPETETRINLWAMLWPRLGWVVSILAVLALAAWLLIPAYAPAPRSATRQSKPSFASAKEDVQLALARKPAERAAADELSAKMVQAESAPAAPSATPLPALEANTPALPYRTSPALPHDDRKAQAGLELAKVKDRETAAAGNKLSLLDSAGPRAVGVNNQPQDLFFREKVTAGDGFSFAPQSPSPFMDQWQTNTALFGAVPARAYAPVPSANPSLAKAGPEQTDVLRQDKTATKARAMVKNETQDGLAGTYAAAQAGPSAWPGGRAVDGLSGTGRQFFKQIETGTEQKRPGGFASTAAILQTFELEQKGDRIRILDADGSVYEGRFTLTEASRKKDPAGVTAGAELGREIKRAEPLKTAAAAKEGSGSSAQNIALRATGTNRSLNQLVVIDCTLGSAADVGLPPGLQGVGGPASDSAGPVQATGRSTLPVPQTAATRMPQGARLQEPSPALLLTRFQGVARIGATNQIQINAVRVAP